VGLEKKPMRILPRIAVLCYRKQLPANAPLHFSIAWFTTRAQRWRARKPPHRE
jgi:hypothetical protein